MIALTVLILALLSIVLVIKRSTISAQVAFEATDADCNADEMLVIWRSENIGVCLKHSPEGRALLIRKVRAYTRFLETHPYITDDGHLDFLYKLLKTDAIVAETSIIHQHSPQPRLFYF